MTAAKTEPEEEAHTTAKTEPEDEAHTTAKTEPDDEAPTTAKTEPPEDEAPTTAKTEPEDEAPTTAVKTEPEEMTAQLELPEMMPDGWMTDADRIRHGQILWIRDNAHFLPIEAQDATAVLADISGSWPDVVSSDDSQERSPADGMDCA